VQPVCLTPCPPKRIGFVSTRFAGTDGVTLEARKWAHILHDLGHSCFWMAGQLDAPPGVWVAEFDLGAASPSIAPVFRPLPRFPAVVADLTVRHSLDLSWGELVAAVRACAPPWLEDVAPVVRYRGEGVGRHEVKTTLRLTYRHEERSLTQEEVNAAHFALMKALAERLPVSFT